MADGLLSRADAKFLPGIIHAALQKYAEGKGVSFSVALDRFAASELAVLYEVPAGKQFIYGKFDESGGIVASVSDCTEEAFRSIQAGECPIDVAHIIFNVRPEPQTRFRD